MSKVLLVNPETSPPNPQKESSSPMGVLWIGSYLEQNGYDATIVSAHDQPDYMDRIRKEMKDSLFVGLSVMTAQIPQALDMSRFIREKDRDLPIVWGGIHPTLLPEETCRNEFVDIAVIGEGEETTLELADFYSKGKRGLKSINGIAMKKGKDILKTKPRRRFDMDSLESVDWNLLDSYTLKNLSAATEGFPVNTGRGCPHRCSFCINTALGLGWRTRSIENIMKDLEELKLMGMANIKFRDENFFVNPERVRKILDGMIKREFNFTFYANTRADYMKEGRIGIDLVRKARDAGWKYAGMGIESGSERILKILKKDMTVEDALRAARVFNKVDGITPGFSFMIGVPTETKEDMMKTVDLMDAIQRICPKAKFYGPQIFRPYPGCDLYKTCVKLGWKHPNTLERWGELLQGGGFYNSADKLPWVSNPDLVEIIIASVPRFKGLNELMAEHKSPFMKLLHVMLFLDGKVRWKTKYFGHPIEIRIKRKLKEKLM